MASGESGSDELRVSRLARLPPGRHGLPREFVEANHRDRLIAGCVQAVEEHGYARMTVAHIIKGAAVSRRTFYEHFDSKEDCFRATLRLAGDHVRRIMREAAEAEGDWPHKVRAALAALLRFFASDPALARLCTVEPLAAGPPVSEELRAAIEALAVALRPGRELAGEELPEDTEKAVTAGLASLVTQRIAEGRGEELGELLPDVVAVALAPFLGAAEAERFAQEGG